MKLSEHFALDELTASQTASRRGISNHPGRDEIENLRRLCLDVLEPMRLQLGRPIIVNSGFRCLPLNRAIGSSDRSQHVQGLAADIKVHGLAALDVCGVIHALGLPYDQLIHEYGSWTHVSIAKRDSTPRGQRLTIDSQGARTGLVRVRA